MCHVYIRLNVSFFMDILLSHFDKLYFFILNKCNRICIQWSDTSIDTVPQKDCEKCLENA